MSSVFSSQAISQNWPSKLAHNLLGRGWYRVEQSSARFCTRLFQGQQALRLACGERNQSRVPLLCLQLQNQLLWPFLSRIFDLVGSFGVTCGGVIRVGNYRIVQASPWQKFINGGLTEGMWHIEWPRDFNFKRLNVETFRGLLLRPIRGWEGWRGWSRQPIHSSQLQT